MKPTWKDKAKALASLGRRVNLENDGCSSAPDLNFRECCEEHDFYYRNCESDTGVSRSQADRKLRKCIQKKWCLPLLPWFYWLGVRACGWIPWKKNQKKIHSGEIAKMNRPIPLHMVKGSKRHEEYVENADDDWYL